MSKKLDFQHYQDLANYVVRAIFKDLQLTDISGDHKILAPSGTEISLDGWAKSGVDGTTYLIEARKHKRDGITQEAMMAIAFKVKHLSLDGGFTVSVQEPQSGAKKIADYEKIKCITLTADSTEENWQAELEDTLLKGFKEEANVSLGEEVRIIVEDGDGNLVSEKTVKSFEE